MPTRHRTLDAVSKPPILVVGGRYACRSLLGQGATARVYQAWDRVLHVERAIKILTVPMRGHDILRERLRSEARLMARLAHPNILKVFDSGSDRGMDYVVMDLAEESLQQRLEQRGPMSVERAGAWILQILSALSAAHAAGIVHRDVKPQNILLRDGLALLADFGIARSLDTRHTQTNVALGSLAFMAPEQRVDAHRVGPQADLYAVATSLYVLITASNPIDLFAAPPDSPRWSMIPSSLAAVLQRAAAYNPEQRYATAREMAEALSAVLDQEISLFGPLITLESDETRVDTALHSETHIRVLASSPPWSLWASLLGTALLLFVGLSAWLPLAGQVSMVRPAPISAGRERPLIRPAVLPTPALAPSPLGDEHSPAQSPPRPSLLSSSATEPVWGGGPQPLSDGKVVSPPDPSLPPAPILGPGTWVGLLDGAEIQLTISLVKRRRGHLATMQLPGIEPDTVRVRQDPSTQVIVIDGPRRREGQLTVSADHQSLVGSYDGQSLVLLRR